MFFTVSKIALTILRPSNAAVLASLFAMLAAMLQWKGGHAFLLITTTTLAMIAILPVGQWLLLFLEYRLPSPTTLPKGIDGAIVLGGGFNCRASKLPDYVELGDAGNRAATLIRLGRHYPAAILVYSGGSGTLLGSPMHEADQARAFFQQQGFDPKDILFEEASRNTWENALNTVKLVRPSPNQTWLLVTSASHMPRAVGVFRKLGWPVVPFPVDFKVPKAIERGGIVGLDWRFNASARLSELDRAVKEWIGLLAYWLSGKTASLLPAPM